MLKLVEKTCAACGGDLPADSDWQTYRSSLLPHTSLETGEAFLFRFCFHTACFFAAGDSLARHLAMHRRAIALGFIRADE